MNALVKIINVCIEVEQISKMKEKKKKRKKPLYEISTGTNVPETGSDEFHLSYS